MIQIRYLNNNRWCQCECKPNCPYLATRVWTVWSSSVSPGDLCKVNVPLVSTESYRPSSALRIVVSPFNSTFWVSFSRYCSLTSLGDVDSGDLTLVMSKKPSGGIAPSRDAFAVYMLPLANRFSLSVYACSHGSRQEETRGRCASCQGACNVSGQRQVYILESWGP